MYPEPSKRAIGNRRPRGLPQPGSWARGRPAGRLRVARRGGSPGLPVAAAIAHCPARRPSACPDRLRQAGGATIHRGPRPSRRSAAL